MICNNLLRQWLVTYSWSQSKTDYISLVPSCRTRIKYNPFQVPYTICGSKVGIYNVLNGVMMSCYFIHNSGVQCKHSYKISGCDSLYDLKRHRYWVVLPFKVYQKETDMSVRGCHVTEHYVQQPSELEINVIDCSFWFRCHINYYWTGTLIGINLVIYC